MDDSDGTLELQEYLNKFIYHVDELEIEDEPAGDGFDREFRVIRDMGIKMREDNTYPATEGRKPCNIKKNRYKDILPFDATRVELDDTGEEGSDYINANFISGLNGFNAYIASQGPLQTTVNDFWRMLWKYDIEVVAMLCRLVELGRKKCEQYWPSEVNEVVEYGSISVTMISEEDLAEHSTKRVLKMEKDGECHMVTQFHYSGWPDHDIPHDLDIILEMMVGMRKIKSDSITKAPMVVHCSAGCGRTGTICAIDYAWDVLKSGSMKDTFSLRKIIMQMRAQRQSMIQAPEQYKFAHITVKSLFEKHLELMEDHTYGNFDFATLEDEAAHTANVDPVYMKPDNLSVASGSSGHYPRKNSALLHDDIAHTLMHHTAPPHTIGGTAVIQETQEPVQKPVQRTSVKKTKVFKVDSIENIPEKPYVNTNVNSVGLVEQRKPVAPVKPSLTPKPSVDSKISVISNSSVEKNNNVSPKINADETYQRVTSEKRNGKNVTVLNIVGQKTIVKQTVSNPVQPLSANPEGQILRPKSSSLKTVQPFKETPQSSIPPLMPTRASGGVYSVAGNSQFFSQSLDSNDTSSYSALTNYSSVNHNTGTSQSQFYPYSSANEPEKSSLHTQDSANKYSYATQSGLQQGGIYSVVDKSSTIRRQSNDTAKDSPYESVSVGQVAPPIPEKRYADVEPTNQSNDKTGAGELNTLGKKTQLTNAIKNLFSGSKSLNNNGTESIVPSDIPGYNQRLGKKPGGQKDPPKLWKKKTM